MKTFKNIFFLTALIAAVFASFTTEVQAQAQLELRPTNEPAIIFNAENMDAYYVSRIPARVRDGEVVLATLKRDRTQVVAKVREGKIVKVGFKRVGKDFTEFRRQPADSCGISGLCLSWQQQRCFYTPWGQCICICGSWYTGRN